MKKLRFLAVLLTVVLLSTALCGCRALDEMRECHAVTAENGDLLLGGTVYKPLPYHEALTCNWEVADINLTAPDVPLLLSAALADGTLWASDDRKLLFDTDADVYYCREDCYEEIARQIIEGPVYTKYTYEYGYWDEAYEYIDDTYTFTAEQKEAMDTILTTGIPVAMDTLSYVAGFEELVYVYRCSADGYFNEQLCTIALMDNTYCLSMTVDNDTVAVYRVPDAYAGTFADILRAYTSLPEAD